MLVNLMFTNDWELFGDGSGNFVEIQERPLLEMLKVFSEHQAHLTLFSEIGQQWAHRTLNTPWSTAIADRWDALLKLSIQQGHDVQLHLHPTWLNAKYTNEKWLLDYSQWQLASLGSDRIRQVIRQGRETLEALLRPIRSDYRCLAFRAGAFCIQPEAITIPALRHEGIHIDSSVVPGATDHLFYDFRKARQQPGSYMADPTNVQHECPPGIDGILELPIHTAFVFDSPLLRRCLPAALIRRWQYGELPDKEFQRWVAERDERTRRIYPAELQPLKAERQKALRSPLRWPGFIARHSAVALDYDFLSPQAFTRLVERAAKMAQKKSVDRLNLVAVGHAKNIPSAENIDRIFERLKASFGSEIVFQSLSQTVKEQST